ncbi:MAG: hypothetical protein HYV65_02900, partial [Candidatus Spechtbacteria bacterium]|nr:hypothetical protein [Candidatus Spechtbacteria bacterium]
VLTSNGAGVDPTFQAAAGGSSTQLTQNFTASGTITQGDVVALNPDGTVATGFTAPSGTATYVSVDKLDATHYVVAYNDNSAAGKAVVCSVSGTTSTCGTPVTFNSASSLYTSVSVLDSTHFVVSYYDGGNSNYGTAIVGLTDGATTISSYGAENVFNSATSNYISVSALDATHFVVSYRDDGNSNYGTAIVGLTDGATTISSYGAENVFNSATSTWISVSALDSTHFVVSYRDEGNSNYGTAIVGLTDGATTISSYGAENVFNSANSAYISVSALDSTHFVVSYYDAGNSNYGTAIVGLTDGATTISSYGAENVFNSATSQHISVSALDSTHFVVSYQDTGSSSIVAANVGLISATTISSYGAENFLTPRHMVVGIASASKTNGQTVSVIIAGVSAIHSGLVVGASYYAVADGSMSQAPATGTYRIGIAISSTSLLINSNRDNGTQFFGDLAEEYLVEGDGEPGDIVSISSTSTEQNPAVVKSTSAYQTNIIGIISTNPAIVIGQLQQGNHQPVALTGRVPVKVTMENGSIQAGDYLTSSSIPGVAMKATKPGVVIGRALESFDCSMALPTMKQCSNATMEQCNNETMKQCNNETVGAILVFVSVGFADPYGALTLNSLGTVGTASNSPASTSVIDYIISDIQAGLRKLGVYIQEGILQVKEIVADRVTADTVIGDTLCAGNTCINQDQLQQLLHDHQLLQQLLQKQAAATN